MDSHVPHSVYSLSEERILSIVRGRAQDAPARPAQKACQCTPVVRHGLVTPDALPIRARQEEHSPRRPAAPPAPGRASAVVASSSASERLVTEHANLVDEVCGHLAFVVAQDRRRQRYLKAGNEALADVARTSRGDESEPFLARASKAVATAILARAGLCTEASPLDCWWTERLLGTVAGLGDGLGRRPTDDEVAAALGIGLPALLALYERHAAALVAMDLLPSCRAHDRAAWMASAAIAVQPLAADEELLLSLYYDDGLTVAEIADRLGEPERQVRERHGRIISCLCSRMLFAPRSAN